MGRLTPVEWLSQKEKANEFEQTGVPSAAQTGAGTPVQPAGT